MSVAPLLDTHAWVWWVHGDARLGQHTIRKLDALPPLARPVISDISLWEVATLVSLGRLELHTTLSAWFEVAAHPRTVHVLPITTQIAADLSRLPDTFHRDPVDRIIVSTSRVHGLSVLTKDAAMTKSGLIRLWPAGSQRRTGFRDVLPRLYELKESIEVPGHPNVYFQSFENNLSGSEHVLEQYVKQERYLDPIDPGAWADLKSRAKDKLIATRRQQGRG